MSSAAIDKWYRAAKKLLFKHKNGFFELPIVSNSPETTVKSIVKMPFVKHAPQKKYFSTNNPFLKAQIHYHEIETGLWFFHSQAHYKENVHYNRVMELSLNSDYYLLNMEVALSRIFHKNGLVNGIPYTTNCSYMLMKPKAVKTHCHFRGNDVTSLVLYMSEEWLGKFLKNNINGRYNILQKFVDSRAELVIFQGQDPVFENAKINCLNLFENSISNPACSVEWSDFSGSFLASFTERFHAENLDEKHFKISTQSRQQIKQAEQFLMQGLNGPFIGVQELADLVGISSAKLKSDFKLVYGESLFQYFRKKQLETAKKILQDKQEKISIKDLAAMFGYANQSKFSTAFKSEFGMLPSEVE